MGDLHEATAVVVDLADEESGVGVAVDAVDVGGDVDVDDVPVLKGAGIGDAVADHLIDRGAQTLREVPVAQRRGVSAVITEEFVSDAVEFGSARGDQGENRYEERGAEHRSDVLDADADRARP